jgi:flagellar M-ring protein FliF
MDATLRKMMARLTAFWKNAGKGVKALIICGIAGVILLTVIFSSVINTTKYTQLFSGLSDSESGQIVTQLKSMSVKYRLDGSTIYVDSSKADETRMELAEAGYPQTALTYSTYMSGNSWAETDSDKQQLELYQLQDRLQQTIDTIPGVTGSVVTIVDNQNDTYVLDTDKVPATASVKLNLGPGLTVSQKQVNGIVQLVSHSVPDLSKDNVTVLDSDGTQLNESGGDVSGDTSDQLSLKNSIENEIKQKVLAVLTPVFGSGNVQVAAGATLDFSQKTTDTTTYTSPNSSTPGVGVPSSQSTATTVSGGTGGTGGTAGVNGGQPTYSTSSATSSGGAVTQTSQQSNYLYNTVNQQIQSQGGTMTGLTIAVLLNNKSQSAAGVSTQNVQQTVAYAVGLTSTTGISVQLIPFMATPASIPAKTAASPISLMMVEISAGVLLLALIFFVFLMVFSRGRKRSARLAVAQADIPQSIQGANIDFKPSPGRSIEQSIEEASSKNIVKNQIADFTDGKPELVAQLLKNWLKD